MALARYRKLGSPRITPMKWSHLKLGHLEEGPTTFLKGQQLAMDMKTTSLSGMILQTWRQSFPFLRNSPKPPALESLFSGTTGSPVALAGEWKLLGYVLSLNGLHAWSFFGNFALPSQDRLIGEANLDIGTTLANDDRCQKPAAEENLNSTWSQSKNTMSAKPL